MRGSFDPRTRERLRAFIGARCGCGDVRIVALGRLGGGAIQQNYALDVEVPEGGFAGFQPLVLRSDAPARLAASLDRAEEFAVLETVYAAGVKVPEPLWLCADDTVLGRPFYVMRRVTGRAAGHLLVRDPELDAHGDELVERLGAELARIHALRPPQPRLDFLALPAAADARDRIRTYRSYLDMLPEPQPEIEWGLTWLEQHAPPPVAPVLCHRDYRSGNYLVDGDRPSAILDWEFTAWGDPAEDLGWFCARCWRFGRDEREAGGIGAREAFHRGYREVAGSLPDSYRLRYWEVMAALRWAVIALLQAERHCSGAEPSLELALTGHLVPELTLEALEGIESLSEVAA